MDTNSNVLSSVDNYLLQDINGTYPRRSHNQGTLLRDASLGRANHIVALVPSTLLYCILPWNNNVIDHEEETHKVYMLGKYRHNETIEVTKLVSFDVGIGALNSRANIIIEGENDRDRGRPPKRDDRHRKKDPLIGLKELEKGRAQRDGHVVGLEIPMKARVKRLKENLKVINTLHGQA